MTRPRTNEEKRRARIDKPVKELESMPDYSRMKARLRIKRIVLELRELRSVERARRGL